MAERNELQARIDRMERELAELRKEVADDNGFGEQPRTRRQLLRGALGAAAGGGALLLANGRPAAASTGNGGTLIWGANNGTAGLSFQQDASGPNAVGPMMVITNMGNGPAVDAAIFNPANNDHVFVVATRGQGHGFKVSDYNDPGTAEQLSAAYSPTPPAGFAGDKRSGDGVRGTSGTGFGVAGYSASSDGVRGRHGTAAPGNFPLFAGVRGDASGDAAGVVGMTTSTTAAGFGVAGRHDGEGVGVQGEALKTNPGGSSAGVKGINRSENESGVGVFGYHQSKGVGVLGETIGMGIGVAGYSAGGIGVVGSGGSGGTDLALTGTGRWFQKPSGGSNPPSGVTVAYIAGDTIRNHRGDIFLCTVDAVVGTTPPTWRKVAAGAPGFHATSGSLNMLARPIRLFETRTGVPDPGRFNLGHIMAPDETYDVQVGGTTYDGQTIPGGAKALIGNLTVTGATGSGFLRMYPTGATPIPTPSTINYQTGSTVANGVIVGLSTGGLATIQCRNSSTHVILDITGFVF